MHTIGTREEWRAARVALLDAEKEHTRRGDELTRMRQELPWVRIDKEYRFHSEDGELALPDLFRGRSQVLVHHFMFAPEWEAGCPSCSSVADGYDGFRVHLEHHDVAVTTVSRAPLPKLLAYRERMGWSFPWVSSYDSDFNFDFGVSYRRDQVASGAEHNFRRLDFDLDQLPRNGDSKVAVPALESPGLSAFVVDDGIVHHTYSAFDRGTDALWGMWQWLDRAPFGRNESAMHFKRHDEYQG